MARKKKKHQEAPGALSDSSDDVQKGVAGCQHVNRALDFGHLKRVLRNGLPSHCQDCANGPKTASGLPSSSINSITQDVAPSSPPLSSSAALLSSSDATARNHDPTFDATEGSLPVSSRCPEAHVSVPSENGPDDADNKEPVDGADVSKSMVNGCASCHNASELNGDISRTDERVPESQELVSDREDFTAEPLLKDTSELRTNETLIENVSALNGGAVSCAASDVPSAAINGVATPVPAKDVYIHAPSVHNSSIPPERPPDVMIDTNMPILAEDTDAHVTCPETVLKHCVLPHTDSFITENDSPTNSPFESSEIPLQHTVPSDAGPSLANNLAPTDTPVGAAETQEKHTSPSDADLLDVTLGVHLGCALDATADTANGHASDHKVSAEDVTGASRMLCLRCGFLGCGSQGPHHALQHFRTPRSDLHCLALALDTSQLWCYECDDAVEMSRRLAQAVQFVQKRAGQNDERSKAAAATTAPVVPKTVALHEERNSEKSAIGKSMAAPLGRVVVPAVKPAPKHSDASKCGRKGEGDGEDDGKRIKGLANLGNTCFFNSVMQNLGQTPHLESLLRERCKGGLCCTFKPAESATGMGPLEVELPQARPLTRALLEFLQEMRCGMPRPRPVHAQICQVAPQFRGNQQHDSHELLRHLIEGVCNEEAKRQKQAVLASFGLSTKVRPSEVDENTKNKIQAYKESVSQTVLDEVFGGVLLTTVICQDCGHVICREEPFKDLSLSIPDDKPLRLVKKVPEETKAQKDFKNRRKDRRDKRGRKNSEPQEEAEGVACGSCTLSGGGSMELAADDEADDEDVPVVADPEVKVAPVTSAKTLAPRPPQPQDGTLLACLHQFTSPELLVGANALSCDGCGNGKRSAASLQLLVQDPPRVLTLHLKRFQQNGRALSKVNRHVPFPLKLDLAPYCSRQKLVQGSPIEYTLYGVVEHSGRLSGGHYTAYVKQRSNGRWFHASDSHVTEVTEAAVLKSQAYLLFYER